MPQHDTQTHLMSLWEKREHGTLCLTGTHIPYRVKTLVGYEIRCKLCYSVTRVATKEEEAA